ncbi:hypothetical protein BaRGS_00021338, partial [Batillaria attramentaria]
MHIAKFAVTTLTMKTVEEFQCYDSVNAGPELVSVYTSRCGSGFLSTDLIRREDWTVVFRAAQGNGQSVYEAFLNTGHHDDNPLEGGSGDVACWSLSSSHWCPKHLRSSLLDQWADGTLGVQRVRYSLYKDGIEVVYVEFHGVGSDLTSWFDSSRVLSSSFTDLTSSQTYNKFSVSGFTLPNGLKRRFHVNYAYSTCGGDIGWLSVVVKGLCDYEKPAGLNNPHFLYSMLPTMV